jgi:hypothetical protein
MLEPEVYGDLTPQTFFKSESDFLTAVAALYSPFQTGWDVSGQHPFFGVHIDTYWAVSEFTTDEMVGWWSTTFDNFSWGDGAPSETWEGIRSVARATDVIDQIQNADSDVSDAVRARYVAEAKVLRAWTMFVLYDFFGPVNVKLDPGSLYDTEITPRLSQEEYVAAIVNDITEAIPNLPDRMGSSDWGRMDKGSARMILLRTYMMEGRWAEAEAVAREILGMGYSLMEDYEDVCNVQENNEIIYSVPAEANHPRSLTVYYWMEIMPNDFQSAGDISHPGGWYGYGMPWDFFNKMYQEGDERLKSIIAEYTDDSGNPVGQHQEDYLRAAVPVKCTENLGGPTGSSNDWLVFRYAEVLLSLAEAINEQAGPTGEALGYANQVRTRSELPAWDGLSQEVFRDSLLAERGREFFAEGVRRQDLIRHGKLIEYALEDGAEAEPHHVLFPIPRGVIQESEGVVTQNCGYSNAEAGCYPYENRYQGQ